MNQSAHGPRIYGHDWTQNAELPGRRRLWLAGPADTVIAAGHAGEGMPMITPRKQIAVASLNGGGASESNPHDVEAHGRVGSAPFVDLACGELLVSGRSSCPVTPGALRRPVRETGQAAPAVSDGVTARVARGHPRSP